ncbi:winged helix-turn-helix transcriptional regulator [Albibacterium indicum]|uniref:winged helix-turn-helix transcriptional regulator n=1 Tax=Albibacterium indicum TaxID=2292082 RepID=UPI000E5063B0|nr:helix-turn-helix domain-containing protein [Pedobacter indicus]
METINQNPVKNKTAASAGSATCKAYLCSVQDTLDILKGKWKISIISCLSFGKRRFLELQREVGGIGAKMLSKELQDLEANDLVLRKVCDTKPITVEYELTDYGRTLQNIIDEMEKWGKKHREKIQNECRGEKTSS